MRLNFQHSRLLLTWNFEISNRNFCWMKSAPRQLDTGSTRPVDNSTTSGRLVLHISTTRHLEISTTWTFDLELSGQVDNSIDNVTMPLTWHRTVKNRRGNGGWYVTVRFSLSSLVFFVGYFTYSELQVGTLGLVKKIHIPAKRSDVFQKLFDDPEFYLKIDPLWYVFLNTLFHNREVSFEYYLPNLVLISLVMSSGFQKPRCRCEFDRRIWNAWLHMHMKNFCG